MPTKKSEKVVEETAVAPVVDWTKAPLLDEHEEQKRRVALPVQSVNRVTLLPLALLQEGGYTFPNTGRMVTALHVVASSKTAVVTVRGLGGKNDMVANLKQSEFAAVGPFAPELFNRVDNAVYVDIAGEVFAAVTRLGV